MIDLLSSGTFYVVLASGLTALGAWLKWGRLLKPLRETAELLNVIVEALADGKLSVEEIKRIKEEADDIPVAIREFLGKS